MTKRELEHMVCAEGKRLGVGSAEFMKRHHEIMEQCSALLMEGKKRSRRNKSSKDSTGVKKK